MLRTLLSNFLHAELSAMPRDEQGRFIVAPDALFATADRAAYLAADLSAKPIVVVSRRDILTIGSASGLTPGVVSKPDGAEVLCLTDPETKADHYALVERVTREAVSFALAKVREQRTQDGEGKAHDRG